MSKLIGTAGHVDHGKTTLIKALTGIDADRLPEEKRRGMTIDIGFAYVDLPEHGRVSIVDVPGHEKFVTNMLVGALGIDVALLCVSADESVMPQTREHLQILELLPVDELVVALTRADLADAETREFAIAEIEELIATTRFRVAPIIPVSAFTGEGLDTLKAELAAALSRSAEESGDADKPWYLPIDRVFTVKGHGCVVTGTLAQGEVKVGDRAFLEPSHREVRVRSIESHGAPAERSDKGKRTALNLAGVKAEEVHRGMALGAPGSLFETGILDARIRRIAEIKHGQRVRVSIGAEEVIARAFLSEGTPDVVQLRLESKVAAAVDQPVIVRRYSPPEVLGGGRVAVPQAKVRRRKEAVELVEAADFPSAILEIVGSHEEGVTTEEICRRLGQTQQALGNEFEQLRADGRLKGFAGLWLSGDAFAETSAKFLEGLRRAHEANPTRATLPREMAVQAAGLSWAGKPLDRIVASLASEGRLEAFGTNIRHPEFRVQLPARQRELLDRVKVALQKESINVPSAGDLSISLNVPPQAVLEILKLGQQAGELIPIAEGIYYTPAQLSALKERLRQIASGKPFPAAAARDMLGTTRKYIIPLLEYFDSIRFTTRVGDNRMINE